jgi:hypothetical protein
MIVDNSHELGVRFGVEALDDPAHFGGLLNELAHHPRVVAWDEIHPE